MYDEKQLEKLIEPLMELQQEQESYVINIIAKRLKSVKTVSYTDLHRLGRLFTMGSDVRKINKKISEISGKSINEIKNILKEVAQDNYKDAKSYYDYKEKPFIPFAENKQLQKTIKAVEEVTLNDFTNFSNSTAFMLKDLNNPLIIKPTKLSKVYSKMIDSAIYSVANGINTYNDVIKQSLKQLTDSGVQTIEYTTDTGKKHYMRMDTVVRRNILDGVKNLQQTMLNDMGKELGLDGVELSVHAIPAPDHEPLQGRQFTNEEFDKMQTGQSFEDVKGNKYNAIQRPIGMWNCRHIVFPIMVGISKPVHNDEQLQEIIENNKHGIKIKDKQGNEIEKSKYWCTQKQREFELKIRKARELKIAAEESGNTALEQKASNMLKRLRLQYKIFSAEAGLPLHINRTYVYK